MYSETGDIYTEHSNPVVIRTNVRICVKGTGKTCKGRVAGGGKNGMVYSMEGNGGEARVGRGR